MHDADSDADDAALPPAPRRRVITWRSVVLGLAGAAWQSLYHCAVGSPVDDPRITSEPGYSWERP